MEDIAKFCSNCKREIPSVNFVMHNVHCQRNIALCPRCKEPFPRIELESHITEIHGKVQCNLCWQEMEQSALENHQTELCDKRLIGCRFCDLELHASEIPEHENYCGSRTEKCDECGEYVMLKYQQLHMDSNHGFLKLDDEPGPVPSWQAEKNTGQSKPTILPSVNMNALRSRKISNASQDATRPTAATNRLSPSKRTNDMPQINSAPSANISKHFHKSSIQGLGEPPPEQNALNPEDLDRLLALHLAEEDLEFLSANEIAAILSGATEIPVPTAPPYHDMNSVHRPPVIDQEVLPAMPFGISERSQSAVNRLAHVNEGQRVNFSVASDNNQSIRNPLGIQSGSEDIVALPCEFCEAMVPADQLVLHQIICARIWHFIFWHKHIRNNTVPETGCRPDLMHRQSLTNNPHPQSIPVSMNNQQPSEENTILTHSPPHILNNLSRETAPRSTSPSDDLVLPCEFCGSLFPAEFLLQHQIICDLNENALSVNNVTPEPRVRTRTRNLVGSPPSHDTSPASPLRRVVHHQPDPDLFAFASNSDNFLMRESNGLSNSVEGNNELVNFDLQFEKNVHKPGVEEQLHKVSNHKCDVNKKLAVQGKPVIQEERPIVRPRRSHPLFPRRLSEENGLDESNSYLNEMRASLNPATRPLLSKKDTNLPVHHVVPRVNQVKPVNGNRGKILRSVQPSDVSCSNISNETRLSQEAASGFVNYHGSQPSRHPRMSLSGGSVATGAVPKQKAGKLPVVPKITKEVQGSASSPVTRQNRKSSR